MRDSIDRRICLRDYGRMPRSLECGMKWHPLSGGYRKPLAP